MRPSFIYRNRREGRRQTRTAPRTTLTEAAERLASRRRRDIVDKPADQIVHLTELTITRAVAKAQRILDQARRPRVVPEDE